MGKNLICIPYAWDPKKKSGVNVSGNDKLNIYMMNACVALISAKRHNPDCDVALITNLEKDAVPAEYCELLEREHVQICNIPYEDFVFSDEYTWSLAFYKLCVLKNIDIYDNICYLDTDVYIQGSFDSIWKECQENILLYDINHGLNTHDYQIFCDETEKFLGTQSYITHYGGEFFAASRKNAVEFSRVCEEIYNEMIERTFQTTRGDEFIVSIAASRMKNKIKNAGAYIFRYWTEGSFHLVSSNYQFNRVSILHLPSEKERGIINVYRKYISKGKLPSDRQAWKAFRLTYVPIIDRLKKVAVWILRR